MLIGIWLQEKITPEPFDVVVLDVGDLFAQRRPIRPFARMHEDVNTAVHPVAEPLVSAYKSFHREHEIELQGRVAGDVLEDARHGDIPEVVNIVADRPSESVFAPVAAEIFLG